MVEFHVKITPHARDQMFEIRDYITYQLMNPDAAINLFLEMQSQIQKLQYMPEMIKTIDEQPWGNHGVRKIIVKNFYVYFWIDHHNSTVHVIAITYAKRNQKHVLSETDKYTL